MEREPGLYNWNVYHEPADTDEPGKFIGTMQADTAALALDQAAQYFEIPSHDLVVTRSDLDIGGGSYNPSPVTVAIRFTHL